jgi:hypothetical protein
MKTAKDEYIFGVKEYIKASRAQNAPEKHGGQGTTTTNSRICPIDCSPQFRVWTVNGEREIACFPESSRGSDNGDLVYTLLTVLLSSLWFSLFYLQRMHNQSGWNDKACLPE